MPLWDLVDPIGIERKYPEPAARGGYATRIGYRLQVVGYRKQKSVVGQPKSVEKTENGKQEKH